MKRHTFWLLPLTCSLLILCLGLSLHWPDIAVRLAGAVTLLCVPFVMFYSIRDVKKK